MAKLFKTTGYRGFEIQVYEHQSRFGRFFSGSNNYGEPVMEVQMFRTVDEVLADQTASLDLCIDQ